MTDSISGLHVGRLLDVPDVPLNLKGPGLKAHTLIVGQSGSGKSFMLGRLLEELAIKTKARIVIFDPNSDFIKFSEVQKDVRNKQHKPASDSDDASDSVAAFQKAWSGIQFKLLTSRGRNDLKLENEKVDVLPATMSWGKISAAEATFILGFDTKNDTNELFQIELIGCDKREPFANFVERTGERHRNVRGGGQEYAIARVYARAREMQSLEIWTEHDQEGSIRPAVAGLFKPETKQRVLCLDLGSFEKEEGRLMAANLALNELWSEARKTWMEAIKQPDDDTRYPVFIVIDEAHNLAPKGPPPGLAQIVRNTLAKIATEGRKYGLFLIMITQRPGRLDETIRTQCDNIILLKMNDRYDLQLVESSFGFIPEGWARRAMEFKQGQLLLAGGLIEHAVYAQVAPRRTAEGGRNIRDEAWLLPRPHQPTGLGNEPQDPERE